MDAERNRPMQWQNTTGMHARRYVCAFGGSQGAPSSGYFAQPNGEIRLCPNCNVPTFFGVGPDGASQMQVPSPMPGTAVTSLPDDIARLYDEARRCASAGAHTGAVLVCRKMLVELAVSQSDTWQKGKHFTQYVEFLAGKVFAPDYAASWLDRIRVDGNQATHELGAMSEADALLLIEFIEMMLKVLFEYPEAAKSATAAP